MSPQVVRDRQAAVYLGPSQGAAGNGWLDSNAFIERTMVMDRTDYTENGERRSMTAEPTSATERSNRRDDLPPTRVPVFRGSAFAGFIDRSGGLGDTVTGAASDGATSRRRETVEVETQTHNGIAGLRAANGIVRLAGEIDDPHELLALRRITASLPGTMLVIDNVWVACE